MQSPVALELLELLARSHIPQPDRPVVRPTDKQGGIRRIETDAIYITAVSLHRARRVGLLQPACPVEVARSIKFAGAILVVLAVALELLELLARSHIPQPDAVVVFRKTPAARSEHGAV